MEEACSQIRDRLRSIFWERLVLSLSPPEQVRPYSSSPLLTHRICMSHQVT
jgi:hypothetical protein